MPLLARFVDSIASSPTVRLNINDGTTWTTLATSRTDPPSAKRARVSNLLTDGAHYPASAYDDRVLQLQLRVKAATSDAVATQLQLLARELDRPGGNILQYQLAGMTHPVFFRTHRLGLDAVSIPSDGTMLDFGLSIPAEPFAYGLPQTLSSVTVNNDPAHATNAQHFDVTGVLGDVETPLVLRINHADVVETWRQQTLFAVRRRGTPSATPYLLQAESMTQGTDTSTQSNTSVMSGSGNNYSRCTFGTATMATRLSIAAHPSSASVDARGRYRVYLRYRNSNVSDTIHVRLLWGPSDATIANSQATTATTTNSARRYLDLGDVQIPAGYDPVADLSGTQRAAQGIYLAVQAQREAGSGTLDFDALLLVPSDDRMALVSWAGFTGPDYAWLDGVTDSVYATTSAGALVSQQQPVATAGLPMVSPGVTNRIYVVADVNPEAASDSLSTTLTIVGSYLPRYLSVRGPST